MTLRIVLRELFHSGGTVVVDYAAVVVEDGGALFINYAEPLEMALDLSQSTAAVKAAIASALQDQIELAYGITITSAEVL